MLDLGQNVPTPVALTPYREPKANTAVASVLENTGVFKPETYG